MPFPQVAATNGGNHASNSTSHTVNLPTGIVAGNLLLVFFSSDAAPTITFPEGWTELFTKSYSTSIKGGLWYKVADGEEGASISVDTSSSQMTAHTSYRITGFSGTPEAGVAVSSSGAPSNPPSLSPTWGAKDTLWFFCCAINGEDPFVSIDSYPANYGNGRYDYSDDAEGAGMGTARRELNTETEDPGAWTMSNTPRNMANTIAIQPAAAAAGRSFGFIMG